MPQNLNTNGKGYFAFIKHSLSVFHRFILLIVWQGKAFKKDFQISSVLYSLEDMSW